MRPQPPTTLTLRVTRAPYIILGILGAIAACMVLTPVIVAVYIVSEKETLTIGIFITTAISWLVAAFMVRMVLWNSVGAEEYELGKEQITYRANYKYFHGKPVVVPVHDLRVQVECVDEEENKGVLVLEGGGVTVRSVVKMDMMELERVLNEISDLRSQTSDLRYQTSDNRLDGTAIAR